MAAETRWDVQVCEECGRQAKERFSLRAPIGRRENRLYGECCALWAAGAILLQATLYEAADAKATAEALRVLSVYGGRFRHGQYGRSNGI